MHDLHVKTPPAAMFKIAFILVGLVAIASSFLPWYSDHLQTDSLANARVPGSDSLQTAQEAVHYNPLSVNAKFVLAAAQQKQGAREDAKQTLLAATELEPLNSATWQKLAWYEIQYWNKPQDGRQHYERAVSLNPTDGPLKAEARQETGVDFP